MRQARDDWTGCTFRVERGPSSEGRAWGMADILTDVVSSTSRAGKDDMAPVFGEGGNLPTRFFELDREMLKREGFDFEKFAKKVRDSVHGAEQRPTRPTRLSIIIQRRRREPITRFVFRRRTGRPRHGWRPGVLRLRLATSAALARSRHRRRGLAEMERHSRRRRDAIRGSRAGNIFAIAQLDMQQKKLQAPPAPRPKRRRKTKVAPVEPVLSEYELGRRAKIKRNNKFLVSVGLLFPPKEALEDDEHPWWYMTAR